MKAPSKLRPPFFLFLVILACSLAGLSACTDSENFRINDSEVEYINVKAFITESFENTAERKKQDTLVPGDSIIFLASIAPSKSIRMQKYFWTMDGKLFANEFSFKSTIEESGYHKIAFVLVDYYGDTLSDTLSLYVGVPPVLDTLGYFPGNKTHRLKHSDFLSFSWRLQEDDSPWKVYYQFILKEFGTGEILVDTLLDSPQYIYRMGFSPLEKYIWTVKASNELEQSSRENISSTFYTAGEANEGAISGTLKNTNSSEGLPFLLTLEDSLGNLYRKMQVYSTDNEKFFNFRPVNSGTYRLTAQVDGYGDFTKKRLDVEVREGKFTELGTILLEDTVPPAIRHLAFLDTLDIADTLRFIVTDGGGEINPSRISAKLENTIITGTRLKGDTLIVPLPDLENSWTFRILSISALDQNSNKATRNFYIRPNKTFEEVSGD